MRILVLSDSHGRAGNIYDVIEKHPEAEVIVFLGDGERDFENADIIIATLQKSEGYIKNELKKLVKMPQLPKLIFEFDKSIMNVIKVEEILKNLNIPKEEGEEE